MSAHSRQYFLGCARVAVDSLKDSNGLPIAPSELHTVYDPLYFVPALIDVEVLRKALDRGKISTEELTYERPPLLDFSGDYLTCLHGPTRLSQSKRATQTLHEKAQWWVVKLYDRGAPNTVQDELRLQPTHGKAKSCGDIFYNWRVCRTKEHSNGDRRDTTWKKHAEYWLAQLSKGMRAHVKRLETKHHLMKAFDALLPFKALFSSFQVGSLTRIGPMKCTEELIAYLVNIRKLWSAFLGDLDTSILDARTVSALELLCPRYSLDDTRKIKHYFAQKKIFRLMDAACRPELRAELCQRVLDSSRILTLSTFMEDTIYLGVCWRILHELLVKPKLKLEVQAEEDSVIDESDYELTSRNDLTFREYLRQDFCYDDTDFACNYLELWYFSMRHFHQLSKGHFSNLRKNKGELTPEPGHIEPGRLMQLAYMAASLGFRTGDALHLLSTSTDIPRVERPIATVPECSTFFVRLDCKDRCNRPSEIQIGTVSHYLFHEKLTATADEVTKDFVTTFAILRDFTSSFWGELILTANKKPRYHKNDVELGLSTGSHNSGIDVDDLVAQHDDGIRVEHDMLKIQIQQQKRDLDDLASQLGRKEAIIIAMQQELERLREHSQQAESVESESQVALHRHAALQHLESGQSRLTTFPRRVFENHARSPSQVIPQKRSSPSLSEADSIYSAQSMAGPSGGKNIARQSYREWSLTDMASCIQEDETSVIVVSTLDLPSLKTRAQPALVNSNGDTLNAWRWHRDQDRQLFVKDIQSILDGHGHTTRNCLLVVKGNGDASVLAQSCDAVTGWKALSGQGFRFGCIRRK